MKAVKAVNLSDMIDYSATVSQIPDTAEGKVSKSALGPSKQASKEHETSVENALPDAAKTTTVIDHQRSK